MTNWQKVGYIGYEGQDIYGQDPTPFMGAQQEYRGAQQEYRGAMGAGPGPNYQPRAVSQQAPRIPLPPALVDRLNKVPVEVFDIVPGYPNAQISSALVANVINAETAIHNFIPPTGHYVVINPADITQEVLLEPFASSDNTTFIRNGLINIYTITGLQGFTQRLYSGGSEFHNPNANQSSVGNRRRWQFGAVISPGDTIQTRLFSPILMSITSTNLDHRVSVKKVTP